MPYGPCYPYPSGEPSVSAWDGEGSAVSIVRVTVVAEKTTTITRVVTGATSTETVTLVGISMR